MTSTRSIVAILSATAYFSSAALAMAAETTESAGSSPASPAAPSAATVPPADATSAAPSPTPTATDPSAESIQVVSPPSTATDVTSLATPSEQPPKPEPVPTLLGSRVAVGGYGGLGVMYTRFADRDAAQVCLEGAVLLDHALSLGAAGCGVARRVRTTYLDPTADPDYRTSFGYGGAVVRYQLAALKFFNVSLGTLIGAGAIASNQWDEEGHHLENEDDHPDVVFVVEPQLTANINMTRWLRLGAVGGYRFVSGVDTAGLSASDVAAPTVGVQVQAGWL